MDLISEYEHVRIFRRLLLARLAIAAAAATLVALSLNLIWRPPYFIVLALLGVAALHAVLLERKARSRILSGLKHIKSS